jgi:hypothetical protein
VYNVISSHDDVRVMRQSSLVSLLLLLMSCTREPDGGGLVPISGAGDDEMLDSTVDVVDVGHRQRLDLGDDHDGLDDWDPDAQPATCKNVDFLFVVDNSASMADEQARLIASFPSFIDVLSEVRDELASMHVGIVTTDAYAHNASGCHVLGALVTETNYDTCGPWTGDARYMTHFDDIDAGFSCAAHVGIEGDGNELPIEAAIRALDGYMAQDGKCNAGFDRDDAVLIIVFMTDEDGHYGDVEDAYDRLLYVNGVNDDSAIVVLTIAQMPGDCVISDYYASHEMIAFTELFTHGFLGDICATDFAEFFDDAVDVIDAACDQLPQYPPVP